MSDTEEKLCSRYLFILIICCLLVICYETWFWCESLHCCRSLLGAAARNAASENTDEHYC